MNTRNLKTIAFTAGFIAVGVGFAADKTTYEDDGLPIFRNNCLKCHNADKMRADLDLATFDALMNGSGTVKSLQAATRTIACFYKW